jgi:hypothetical protein
MGYIFFKPLFNSSSLISFSLRAICVILYLYLLAVSKILMQDFKMLQRDIFAHELALVALECSHLLHV